MLHLSFRAVLKSIQSRGSDVDTDSRPSCWMLGDRTRPNCPGDDGGERALFGSRTLPFDTRIVHRSASRRRGNKDTYHTVSRTFPSTWISSLPELFLHAMNEYRLICHSFASHLHFSQRSSQYSPLVHTLSKGGRARGFYSDENRCAHFVTKYTIFEYEQAGLLP